MFTIKSKLIFAYTLVFGLMLTGFSVVIYHSVKRAAFTKLDANLKSYAVSLQSEIEEELGEMPGLNPREIASIHAEGLKCVRYQLFGPDGRNVLKDSLLYDSPMKKSAEISEKRSIFESRRLGGRKYRIYWSKMETEQDSVYVLETAASMKDTFEDLDRLFYLFLIIIPLGLLLTGVAAYFITKAAFKPITRMTETARKISGKNLSRRLELPAARDEVRNLGETLNEMIGRIDSAFKRQKEFVANASHEIKTPLTIMQTELELTRKRITDQAAEESINTVLSGIGELTSLTNSLLMLARLDASGDNLNLRSFRADELLLECVQSINSAAAMKNIRLDLSVFEEIELYGDREKLKSVFINLLDNAVKYSSSGGSIFIKLKKIKNASVEVSVEDEGIGIPPEDLPNIFNRFYRSNEIRAEITGSGLGLAIAREIVEMHGGTISAENKKDKGAVFKVTLPIEG